MQMRQHKSMLHVEGCHKKTIYFEDYFFFYISQSMYKMIITYHHLLSNNNQEHEINHLVTQQHPTP
jgi:hypothetical protein